MNYSQNLEESLLASLAIYPENFSERWAQIPPDVFYLESHRRLYRVMDALYRQYGAFDFITIVERLRDMNLHDDILLLNAIARKLTEEGVCSALGMMYTHELLTLYRRRIASEAYAKAANLARDGHALPNVNAEVDAIMAALTTHEDETESLLEEIMSIYDNGTGLTTGYSDIDRETGGMTSPGLVILAARPSMGKSSLARGIIRNVLRKGHRVFWYSEDQAKRQIYWLELAHRLRTPTEDLRKLPRETIAAAVQELQEEWRARLILTDKPMMLADLMSAARASAAQLIVVDYLQKIDTPSEREYDKVTEVSKGLKTLALQLSCPVLALAQLNRGTEVRADRRPTLSDLRASGQIEQDADQVWALHREDYYDPNTDAKGKGELLILKNKTGKIGSVTLTWRANFAEYTNHRLHP